MKERFSFFEKYSENGIIIKVMRNNTTNFTLVPETSSVSIGEWEKIDEDIKKIGEKNISGVRKYVFLFGRKESVSTDERVVYLKCDGEILLTLSF